PMEVETTVPMYTDPYTGATPTTATRGLEEPPSVDVAKTTAAPSPGQVPKHPGQRSLESARVPTAVAPPRPGIKDATKDATKAKAVQQKAITERLESKRQGLRAATPFGLGQMPGDPGSGTGHVEHPPGSTRVDLANLAIEADDDEVEHILLAENEVDPTQLVQFLGLNAPPCFRVSFWPRPRENGRLRLHEGDVVTFGYVEIAYEEEDEDSSSSDSSGASDPDGDEDDVGDRNIPSSASDVNRPAGPPPPTPIRQARRSASRSLKPPELYALNGWQLCVRCPFSSDVQLDLPATLQELENVLHDGRNPQTVARFPHLSPVEPQAVRGQALFVALPDWGPFLVVAFFNTAAIDSRVFAAYLPPYASADFLLRAAEISFAAGFSVFVGDDPEPLPDGVEAHLFPGVLILILHEGGDPGQQPKLPTLLGSPLHWTRVEPLPHPDIVWAYCLAQEHTQCLHVTDFDSPFHFRRRLAEAIGASEGSCRHFPATPAIADCSLTGVHCRSVLAVFKTHCASLADNLCAVLLDKRAVADGFRMAFFATSSRAYEVLRGRLQAEAPLGWEVFLAPLGDHVNGASLQNGQVITVEYHRSFGTADTVTPAASTTTQSADTAAPSNSAIPDNSVGDPPDRHLADSGGRPDNAEPHSQAGQETATDNADLIFLLLAPDYKPESGVITLAFPSSVPLAIASVNAARSEQRWVWFPVVIPVMPQPDLDYIYLLAKPSWPAFGVFVAFDTRAIDGRLFCVNVPMPATRQSLLAAAGQHGRPFLQVFVRDMPWPLPEEQGVDLQEGDLISFCFPDNRVAILSSPSDRLLDSGGWVIDIPGPVRSEDSLWVLGDEFNGFFRGDQFRYRHLRSDIAALLGLAAPTLSIDAVYFLDQRPILIGVAWGIAPGGILDVAAIRDRWRSLDIAFVSLVFPTPDLPPDTALCTAAWDQEKEDVHVFQSQGCSRVEMWFCPFLRHAFLEGKVSFDLLCALHSGNIASYFLRSSLLSACKELWQLPLTHGTALTRSICLVPTLTGDPEQDLGRVQAAGLSALSTLLEECVQQPDSQAFFLAATLLETLLEHFASVDQPDVAHDFESISFDIPQDGARQATRKTNLSLSSCIPCDALPTPQYTGGIPCTRLPYLTALNLFPAQQSANFGPTDLGFTWRELCNFLSLTPHFDTWEEVFGEAVYIAKAAPPLLRDALSQLAGDTPRGRLCCFTDGSFFSSRDGAECCALAIAAVTAVLAFSEREIHFFSDCVAALGAAQGTCGFAVGGIPEAMAAAFDLRHRGCGRADFFSYVPGHQGAFFNEAVDMLAKSSAKPETAITSTQPSMVVLRDWLGQGGARLGWATLILRQLQGVFGVTRRYNNHRCLEDDQGTVEDLAGLRSRNQMPSGHHTGIGQGFQIDRTNATVVYSDPRRMYLRITCPQMSFLVCAMHAPQRAIEAHLINSWWDETRTLVNHHRRQSLVILAGDVNSSVGSVTSAGVGDYGAEIEDDPGTRWRSLIDEVGCFAPCTFAAFQWGPTATYQHKRGGGTSRPDMIAIPATWASGILQAWVAPEVHVALATPDHLATCGSAKVHFMPAGKSKSTRKRHFPAQLFTDPGNREHILQAFLSIPSVPWGVSAHAHAAIVVSHLQTAFGAIKTRSPARPRHPYISEDTWGLQRQASKLRRRLQNLRGYKRGQLYAFCFDVWRHFSGRGNSFGPQWAQAWDQWFFPLALHEIVALVRVRTYCRDLRQACRQDRDAYICRLTEEVATRPSSEVHNAIHRLLCHRRKKPYSLEPLPTIVDAKGQVCADAEAVQRRWRQHFASIEGGRAVDPAALVEHTLAAEQAFGPWPSPSTAIGLPNFCDLRRMVRTAKAGKAPGMDGLPSELLRGFSQQTAEALMPLLLKLIFRGAEAVGFKGAEAVRFYKGKGSTQLCENFRSILLIPNFAKALHQTLRPQIRDLYVQAAPDLQLGGKPQKSVVFGSHICRTFLRWTASTSTPSFVLFADISAAFYSAIRPLIASSTAGKSREEAAGHLLNADLPDSDVHAILQHMQEPTAFTAAGATQWQESLADKLTESTWFLLQSDSVPVLTSRGTRPGSTSADLLFAMLVGRILARRDELLSGLGRGPQVPLVPWDGAISLAPPVDTAPNVPLDDLVWADDISCMRVSPGNATLASNVACTAGGLSDAFAEFGFRLSYGPAKTAALVQAVGNGSRKARQLLFSNRGLKGQAACWRNYVFEQPRLLYLSQLCRAAPPAIWALLKVDRPYADCLQHALGWLYGWVHATTPLPDPNAKWPEWLHCITTTPNRFKGLVLRAQGLDGCRNVVIAAYAGLYRALRALSPLPIREPPEDNAFGMRHAFMVIAPMRIWLLVPHSVRVVVVLTEVWADSADTWSTAPPVLVPDAQPGAPYLDYVPGISQPLLADLRAAPTYDEELLWEVVIAVIEPVQVLRDTVQLWKDTTSDSNEVQDAADNILLLLDPDLLADSVQPQPKPKEFPADAVPFWPDLEPFTVPAAGEILLADLASPPPTVLSPFGYTSISLKAARAYADWTEQACHAVMRTLTDACG
ncbi:unnamed protein product, partial [Symbiodinium necroappetens]